MEDGGIHDRVGYFLLIIYRMAAQTMISPTMMPTSATPGISFHGRGSLATASSTRTLCHRR